MNARKLWCSLKETHSVGAVIAALIGLGFTLAVIAGGYVGLPERVQHQGDVLVELIQRESDRDRKLDRVLCLVEAIAAEQDPVARGCVR